MDGKKEVSNKDIYDICRFNSKRQRMTEGMLIRVTAVSYGNYLTQVSS